MTINLENYGYPVRHKKKIPFRPQIIIPHDIIQTNIEIFQMEAELDRFILSKKDYLELVSDASTSNIHISTKLEGNPLTKAEVKRITKGTITNGMIGRARAGKRSRLCQKHFRSG